MEEDREDTGIALLLIERLRHTTGDRLTAPEFLREIGMEEFVSQVPGSWNQRG